eukprot:TRINITY_DN1116_c0_g1_i1.p1 TRINITY_DN1116_c0_g1~~TRINITY_DN1116_c0_g1_i1.p1  ORF type:complete len:627 (-),score=231.95 TRINITY_DN1116_c0_g1_i1:1076-2896(-)
MATTTIADDGAAAAPLTEDASMMPIAILIDQLSRQEGGTSSSEVQQRLNAVRKLDSIAKALGPDRTRAELIPFLTECVDDEDEVLVAMAEELAKFTNFVGGSEYAHVLLPPLETLASAEEVTVREKAVEAITAIAAVMNATNVEQMLFPIVKRLALREWFTSRASAGSVVPAMYPVLPEKLKLETRQAFFKLCKDETPMVRRACAIALGQLSKFLDAKTIKAELLPLFQHLAADEQDSVRLLTVDAAVSIAAGLPAADSAPLLLPSLLSCCRDKSWRVRYMAADHIVQICEAFGAGVAASDIVPAFVQLMHDTEAEVRTASALHATEVARRVPKQLAVAKLIPGFRDLVGDTSQHVRAAVAGVVTGLVPVLGKDDTEKYVVELLLALLKDDFPEVRLNVISTMEHVVSKEACVSKVVTGSLLPAIIELAEDHQWRVRLGIIEKIPLLARQFGLEFFDAKLSLLCMGWLEDPIYAIREAATQNLKQLAESFGAAWVAQHVVPKLQALRVHPNYLHRMTTLFAIVVLNAVGDAKLDDVFLPLAVDMLGDKVANVRFNACKALAAMLPRLGAAKAKAASVGSLLTKLTQEDPDRDVRFFAAQTLASCPL